MICHRNFAAETSSQKFTASGRAMLPDVLDRVPRSVPIFKSSNRSTLQFCAKRLVEVFVFCRFVIRTFGASREARPASASPYARLSRLCRLNPCGRRSLARFSTRRHAGQPSPTSAQGSHGARCGQGFPLRAAKRPSLTFAVRRAPQRCRAGTEERLQAEQKN